MLVNKLASAVAAGAMLSLGALAYGSVAQAADLAPMVRKAPPPAPIEALDIHGFVDFSFKNAYITPRGLLVHRTGLATQMLMGLSGDIYKNSSGFINSVSLYGGVWSDLWSDQHHPAVGPWNEFDWFAGVKIGFAQHWTFGAEYIEFIPPAASFITSFPATERNVEFSLSYDDTHWGWPISLHPYVKFFWAAQGPSTVVLGKGGDTFDVEIGIVPTLDLRKYGGLPITLTAPTWVTVGPSDYWNRNDGTTNVCGPTLAIPRPCGLNNAGVFSTGLTATASLASLMPKRLGNWYVKAGFQYYHIMNDALLAAQIFTGSAGGAANVLGNFPSAHRDIVVGFGGIGFGF